MDNNILVVSSGYNCKEYLNKHLESINTQSYDKVTHLLIDDGSDDGTSEILQNYVNTSDKKVFLFRNV